MSSRAELHAAQGAYSLVEDQFQFRLDQSLDPRGPDLLYELVRDLQLAAGAHALDVGCREGKHTLQLAQCFGFVVHGIDPDQRELDLAKRELAVEHPDLGERVQFSPGVAEDLPVENDTVDLIWCRDVLSLVADLDAAYAEFRRVLKPGGRALVYQMFATDRLEPKEAEFLFDGLAVVPTSADPSLTETAIATSGLRVDQFLELGPEWGEHAEENGRKPSRKLLHAARLVRDPERYVAEFGQVAYDIMLSDCLWHVYRMIGKLSPRAYLLSAPDA